jgi:hypothetical protein
MDIFERFFGSRICGNEARREKTRFLLKFRVKFGISSRKAPFPALSYPRVGG